MHEYSASFYIAPSDIMLFFEKREKRPSNAEESGDPGYENQNNDTI